MCSVGYRLSNVRRVGIDGCTEAGWPRAHHDQIICRVLERAANPEHLRELSVRRVAQDQLAAPHHNRCIGLAHSELLQDLCDVGIGLEIEPREGEPVLGQELARAEGIARIA